MQEHAKKKARDIAKTRIEAGYKRDTTQAISSSDYENTPAKSLAELEGTSPSLGGAGDAKPSGLQNLKKKTAANAF